MLLRPTPSRSVATTRRSIQTRSIYSIEDPVWVLPAELASMAHAEGELAHLLRRLVVVRR